MSEAFPLSDHPEPPDRPDESRAGVPFSLLCRVEIRKRLDNPTGVLTVAACFVLPVLSIVAAMTAHLHDDASTISLLRAAGTPLGLVLGVLGAACAGEEWGMGTMSSTLLHERRRLRVVAAQAVAALAVASGAMLTTLLGVALGNSISLLLAGHRDDLLPDIAPGVVAAWIVARLAQLVLGFTLGMALMRPLVAMGIQSAVTVTVVLAQELRHAMPWPRRALGDGWLDLPAGIVALGGGHPSPLQWRQFCVAALLWTTLALAAGSWRVATRRVD